ncbi:MAG: protein kinase [Planctomycetaceae bacterium]|jgi:serine/threonine protein kinase|nr:protein kinase [Planctomycetaceae bacterium]
MSSSNPKDPTVLHNKDRNATKYHDVSALQEPRVFSPGHVLGENFRLEKILGRGGMGEAWKAYDQTADRFVVLKFIPKEIQHVQEAMDLLRSSFKKVHALQHQHICPVYGLFTDHQHGLYLAMKYIDGVSLDVYQSKYVKKYGKILFSDIVQILWGIAKGLDYAHEKKVIHRDIKPLNIMIGKSDGVQIIDFGLAEDIRTSMTRFSRELQMSIAGTRPYMAPEQWRGRLQDARTDQYALAVTAYEIFSGHVPFWGNDVAILRECVLNEEPAPIAELPEYVNNALLKALSKKREDRYENCRAFIKAMITKPQESENAETNVNEILLSDEANTEQKERLLPPTIFVSSEPASVVQKTETQIKNIKPLWFVLTEIFIAIIILSAGLFLIQKTYRPTVSPQLSLAKQPVDKTTESEKPTESSEKTEKEQIAEPPTEEPINTTSLAVESPETKQEIIEPKQPVDDLPNENVIEEKTKTEEPAVKKIDENELLKITEFKNGYLPVNRQQKDFQWTWHGRESSNLEDTARISNPTDVLRIDVHKKVQEKLWVPSLEYKNFPLIKGNEYHLECELRAIEPTSIVVYIPNRNRPEIKRFHLLEDIVVAKDWKTYQHKFLIHENEQSCFLVFDHFKAGIIYEIRRVSLRNISINVETPVLKTSNLKIIDLITEEPVEMTKARQQFEKEIEQIKKPYREGLETEINLAKKNNDSNRSLKLSAELKHHVSEKGLKPTVYEPDRRWLATEKIRYKNKIELTRNTYKISLTELVQKFVQADRIKESKIVQEMIEHIEKTEIITAKLLKREPIPIIRLILEITADGKGRFRIERGLTSDPPDNQFRGYPFNMSAFPHAVAFCGDDGLGRIIWDFQDSISVWHDSGWAERTHNFSNLLSGFKIDENKGILLFYPDSTSNDWEEKRPGLLINRYVKYPIRLCCDFIEKQDGLLFTSINLNDSATLEFFANFAQFKENGNFHLFGGVWSKSTMLRKTISLSQLPFEFAFELPEKYRSSSPYIHRMRRGDTNGSATRFDLIAKFSAWIGFTIKQQDNFLFVENVLEKSPAKRAGLQVGDVIVMLNGKNRTEKEAKELLDSSTFGDLIVLTVVRCDERKVIRFHVE